MFGRGHSQQAHLQGELRVGHARPAQGRRGAEGTRAGHQRLAAVGRVDRDDRAPPTASATATRAAAATSTSPVRTTSAAASGSSAIPASGCSDDMYRQFNAPAFQGPLTNSVGLESPNGYLRGCFLSQLDFTIARNIRMGGARNLQLRVDMFNAPNAAGILGRNTTMNLASPADPVTITNLPYDPATGRSCRTACGRPAPASDRRRRGRRRAACRSRFGSRSKPRITRITRITHTGGPGDQENFLIS